MTDRAIILERGCVVHAADSATLAADRAALETHLGVTDSGPRRGAQGRSDVTMPSVSDAIGPECISRCEKLIRPYIRRTLVIEIYAAEVGLASNPLCLKLELFSAFRLLQGAAPACST